MSDEISFVVKSILQNLKKSKFYWYCGFALEMLLIIIRSCWVSPIDLMDSNRGLQTVR